MMEWGGEKEQTEMNREAGAEVIDINLIPSSRTFESAHSSLP